jgi:hypothetical protein
MLYLMNMEIPPEMTGTLLIALLPASESLEQAITTVELHG